MKKRFYSFVIIAFVAAALVVTPLAKPASAAVYNFYDLGTWPVVGYGYKTSGAFVQAVQANLWSAGYSGTVGSVDGYFGAATASGVKKYQTYEGLAVDGIVGKQMWTEMEDHTIYHDTRVRRFVHNSSTYTTEFFFYADGTGTTYSGRLVDKRYDTTKANIGTLWRD